MLKAHETYLHSTVAQRLKQSVKSCGVEQAAGLQVQLNCADGGTSVHAADGLHGLGQRNGGLASHRQAR